MPDKNLVNYIFLSRCIPLPLSALKIINKNFDNFDDILDLSKYDFKQLLKSFKKNYNIPLRNLNQTVHNFAKKKNHSIKKNIENILNLCQEKNIKCTSFFEKDFPFILRNIKSPPKLVFIKGNIKEDDDKAVAMIGTRNPTQYGKKMARKIARRFAEKGFTIVSGFARGIDTISMRSALENGGRSIGVIASGILNIYPKENRVLVDKLTQNGALISERFPEKNVNVRALQIRNRITSALGLANIFVEGTKSSGTKWQLKFGKEEGRVSIAVKPKGNYEQAYVPNLIIHKEKGKVITNLEDIDDLLGFLDKQYKRRKEKRQISADKYHKMAKMKFRKLI